MLVSRLCQSWHIFAVRLLLDCDGMQMKTNCLYSETFGGARAWHVVVFRHQAVTRLFHLFTKLLTVPHFCAQINPNPCGNDDLFLGINLV